ncbi:MAG: ATPase [Planctomycetota bacterium]|nr:MAG: ATPase [Planctomycetota bacterium]
MLARIRSGLLQGIDALPCEVEVDFDPTAIERALIVGLPDAAVKEALERVRTALTNSGYMTPPGRLLINLAPADLKKEGPVYDLPIAVGLLFVQGVIQSRDEASLDFRATVFAGELALDGRVRPVTGALALASMAKASGARSRRPRRQRRRSRDRRGHRGLRRAPSPRSSASSPASSTSPPLPPPDITGLLQTAKPPIDFADVRGQESVKRALTIAAAGSHNIVQLCPSVGHGGGGVATR